MISPLPLPVTLALGKLPATPMLPDLRMKGQLVRGTSISDRTAGQKRQECACMGS